MLLKHRAKKCTNSVIVTSYMLVEYLYYDKSHDIVLIQEHKKGRFIKEIKWGSR